MHSGVNWCARVILHTYSWMKGCCYFCSYKHLSHPLHIHYSAVQFWMWGNWLLHLMPCHLEKEKERKQKKKTIIIAVLDLHCGQVLILAANVITFLYFCSFDVKMQHMCWSAFQQETLVFWQAAYILSYDGFRSESLTFWWMCSGLNLSSWCNMFVGCSFWGVKKSFIIWMRYYACQIKDSVNNRKQRSLIHLRLHEVRWDLASCTYKMCHMRKEL